MADGSWPAALIFDFDGLLMDTESNSLESWRQEWRQWGLSLDEGSFFAEHGGDLTEQRYDELAVAVGPAFDRNLSHERRIAHRNRLSASMDLMPGLRDWLGEALGAGIRLAIASSSPGFWVTGHLGRLGLTGIFETFACGDEVTAAKPAPDVYRLALARLGLAGSQAVAVEDSPHGVAAARAAGLRCIAIRSRFWPASRFAAADLVIDSARQVGLADALRQCLDDGAAPLDQQDVAPAAVVLADALAGADDAEAGGSVQREARGVLGEDS